MVQKHTQTLILGTLIIILLFSVSIVLATIFFDNGLEEGDFSEWTSTTTDGTCVLEVLEDSEVAHHGNYYAHAERTDSGSYAYARKVIGGSTTLYTRIEFMIEVYPVNNDRGAGIGYSTWQSIAGTNLHSTGGTNWYIQLWVRGGGTDDGTTLLALDTWYTLELYVLHADGTDGEAIIYLDGEIEASLYNIDTDDYGDTTNVDVGLTYMPNTGAIFFDCVVISDTYIGEEVVIIPPYEVTELDMYIVLVVCIFVLSSGFLGLLIPLVGLIGFCFGLIVLAPIPIAEPTYFVMIQIGTLILTGLLTIVGMGKQLGKK
jgi:hypothetical protein